MAVKTLFLVFLNLIIIGTSIAIPNHLNRITGFLPEDGKGNHLHLGQPRVAGLLEPCPSGCCPFASWFCCEDNMSCAQTMEDCPLLMSWIGMWSVWPISGLTWSRVPQ